MICTTIFAQPKINWGKPTPEEIAFTDVSFEPGADAVILSHVGNLEITDYGYELETYIKIKILNPNGFRYAQEKLRFSSTNYNDNVTINRAQTLNFENGSIQVTEVKNSDILSNKIDENTKEITLIFPNVKVGSIIEYKITRRASHDLWSTPWYFQHDIPSLYSFLKLKNVSYYDYISLIAGERISKKYANQKGLKEWELINIPSTKTYTFIYNVNDFRDRLSLQYNSSRGFHGTYSSANTWKDFRSLLNKDLAEATTRIDFHEIEKKIPNGKTQFETLQNCVDYIQKNYKWTNKFSIVPRNLKDNLLASKKGDAGDLNVLLHEILKIKNIQSEFIITSFRSRGKLITSFPVYARMSNLLLIVKLDKENLVVDVANADLNNLRYPFLNFFNHYAIKVKSVSDAYFLLQPALSEFHSQRVLELKPDKMIYKIKDQHRGYITKESSKTLTKYPNEGYNTYESGFSEQEDWKIKTKIYTLENTGNLLILENPIIHQIDDYKIDSDRGYPIELEFPILTTVQLKINVQPPYAIDLRHFNVDIKAFDNQLIYSQNYTQEGNIYTLNWQLLINKIRFDEKEIKPFLDFLNKIKLSNNQNAILQTK